MPDNELRCPACGSPSILGPDPDGLCDCASCGRLFNPDLPFRMTDGKNDDSREEETG